MTYNILSGVVKIVVLRATALGDFILAVPALHALHIAYPLAEIVYLGRRWHAEYLPGRLPGIRRVLNVPSPQGEDIARGMIIDAAFHDEFIHQMRVEQFDLAVQLHGGGLRSNPFMHAFDARFSVGTRAPGALALTRWIPYVFYQHESIRCLEIVSLAGAYTHTNNLSPMLPVFDSDLAAAQPAFQKLNNPYAVIHAGSTDPRRMWPPDYFAAVADYCMQSLHLDVVLTGTPIDTNQVLSVEASMQARPVNLLNQLDLPGLTGLLSRAALVISNDTGPMHLANSLGVKTIGLFMDESVINFLPLSRKNFYPLIAWDRRCPACGMYCDKTELDHPSGPCHHRVSFLARIPVRSVLDALHHMHDY
jgi:ADP-heptose:LPS heptosyltransferase